MPEGIPFNLQDYMELVDWTGRQIKKGKRGAIDNTLPPILERLNIAPNKWLTLTTQFESSFKFMVGNTTALKQASAALGYLRTPGHAACQALLQ